MSGYLQREDRLFDPTTGALVGFIDARGNEQIGIGGSSLRGKLAAENATYLRVGNSYDQGVGANGAAAGMSALVAAAKGWTETNIAVGGATLADYVNFQFGSRVITAGDNISGTFGLNDLRYYGPLPVRRAQFMQNLYASLAYLAIPDANKVHAAINAGGFTTQNPAVTYTPNTAAWLDPGTVFRGNNAATRALVTTTSGATVSAPVNGDTIAIWYGQSAGTAGRITPIIDGRTFAYGSVGTEPIADAPSTAGQWMLSCIVISGLNNGAHTVTLRSDTTAPTVILAWAGINSGTLVGANVYVTGIPPLRPAHWNIAPGFNGSTQAGTDGKPVNFYELQAAAEWNQGMRGVCDQLRWQGLNVRFVDVSNISFQSVANVDLHPEPPQHYLYAQAELAVMAEAKRG